MSTQQFSGGPLAAAANGEVVKKLQLEKLVQRIDNSFGEELDFSERKLNSEELGVLSGLFGDSGFQCFLQDQVSRQIIRDYTVNALRLGYLEEDDLEALGGAAASVEGRAALSLQMLMSSVEDAPRVCGEPADAALEALQVQPDSPPHIEIVRN